MRGGEDRAESTAARPGELTFRWGDPRPFLSSLVLPAFIFLSLFLHALSFYVFQIVYPPSAHVTPPPARLSVIAPGSPESETLLRWIEAEDPALAARPAGILPPDFLRVPYSASFEQVRATPKIAAKPPKGYPYPPVKDTSALVEMWFAGESRRNAEAGRPSSPAPLQSKMNTVIHLEETLASRFRGPSRLTDGPAATSATGLQPTRFLAGVTERGEVRYVFAQNASGDAALDAAAMDHLLRQKLLPVSEPEPPTGGDEASVWGFVTFYWGGSVYSHKPTPESAPLEKGASSPGSP